MSNGYQIILFKKCLTVSLFAINIFGLWSFKFVRRKQQIKYSFIKAFYSLTLLCIGMSAYGIIGMTAFDQGETIFFGSVTLKLVLYACGNTILVSFVIAYLGQHWSASKIELTYNKCMSIVDIMTDSFWSVDISFYILETIMKTIVFDTIHEFVSFNNIIHSSDAMRAKPVLALFLMLPDLASRMHVNMFYCSLVAINVYMKKLNGYLNDVVTKSAFITGQNSARHKYFKMDNYCCLSDEIDKLSSLYLKIVDATNSLNSIFAVAITFWNATTHMILVVQFLYQFIALMELIHERKESTVMLYAFGYFSILLSLVDLLTTSNACQRIVNSVSERK